MKTKHKHWAVLTASTLGLTGLSSAANLGGEKYIYDDSGNIVEKSLDGQVTKVSYDVSNQAISLASAGKGSERISYDSAGRPIFYKDASSQTTRQLSYGYADKVLKADNFGSTAEFFYNAEGQLVGKSVAGKFTPYTWDGNVMAAEGAEAFTNEDHVTGGVPVMVANSDAIVSDYLGNTLSHGHQRFTITAFGEGLEEGRFTGKVFVKELGGYSFLHRLFAPELTRWTTSDPCGFPDGTNNSLYVKSDPFGDVDPLGLIGAGVKKDSGTLTWNNGTGAEITWAVDRYEITCDDNNTKVDGFKPMTGVSVAGHDVTHNCHGFAFAGSGYWINDPAGIITGDSWNSAKDGNLDSNKNVRAVYAGHSASVTTITSKLAKKVTGKDGARVGTSVTDPDKQWSYGAPSGYYEK